MIQSLVFTPLGRRHRPVSALFPTTTAASVSTMNLGVLSVPLSTTWLVARKRA